MCSYLCLFYTTLTIKCSLGKYRICTWLVAYSIHFVVCCSFHFLLLTRNNVYIISISILTLHVLIIVLLLHLGGHHFDNCSKWLMATWKPCAPTTKSSNFNDTLVMDDMFQLWQVSHVWTSANSTFSTYNRKLSLRDRESLYVWTNGWKCVKLSRQ